MTFNEFVETKEVLEILESLINEDTRLNENNILDNISKISSENTQALLSALVGSAKYVSKKGSQASKLLTPAGLEMIKQIIHDDILGSSDITYLTRKWKEPNRYKKLKGLEQFILDMKEERPSLVQTLSKITNSIIS